MSDPKYAVGYEDPTGKIILSRSTYNQLPEAEKHAKILETYSAGMPYEIYELRKIPRRREKKDEAQAWGEVKRRGVFGTL